MTTATIEKYSTEELLNICIDKFYEELATSNKIYFLDTVREIEGGQIRPRTRLQERLKRVEGMKERISEYEVKRAKEGAKKQKAIYQKAMLMLKDKLEFEENPTIENQKKYYEKTQDVFMSHSYTEFPLTGKINSLYDGLNCVIVYYDNLVTEEMVSKLENAPTLEEKKQIVKDNVEITHALIRVATCSRKCVALTGKLDEEFTDVSNPHASCLPSQFANWAHLTEEDCEEIANQELKEFILSKIK